MSFFSLKWISLPEIEREKLETQFSPTLDEQKIGYNPFRVSKMQKYNPINSLFSQATMSLDHQYHMVDLEHVRCLDKVTRIPIHIKYAPLLDPIHYLIGKYEKFSKEKITALPDSSDSPHIPKIVNYNNAAYIDCFFNYLASNMLHTHGCINSIDYYGSSLAIQDQFKFNIADDIAYLQDSEHFRASKDLLYTIPAWSETASTEQNMSRGLKPKIITGQDVEIMDFEDIDFIVDKSNKSEKSVKSEKSDKSMEVVFEMCERKDSLTTIDSDDNSSIENSSVEDNEEEDKEEDDDEEEDDDDDDDVDDDDDNDEEDDELFAYIKNFPVQMICLEKCDGTLDQLLENEDLKEKEIASALIQVNFTLMIYQKAFQFTHNDLHTNNILWKKTDLTFIHYVFKNNTYRVPTFGRIFKIIDFGRGIYRFQNKWFCSDSFAPEGDAHSQYNCEPFLNPNKPRLDPNPSFDLCRLGCSLYDFVFDIDAPLPTKMTELQKTVMRWCTDDEDKNMLYKKSGEERYPNFKLYKMIARLVHNNLPEDQLSFPLFSQFLVPRTNKGKRTYLHQNDDVGDSVRDVEQTSVSVNVDKIPTYS